MSTLTPLEISALVASFFSIVALGLAWLTYRAARAAGDHAAIRQSVAACEERVSRLVREELAMVRREAAAAARDDREEASRAGERLREAVERMRAELSTAVSDQLQKMTADNGRRLEEMRKTVAEKLEGTLERRLGESFKLVSDRLEQVHRGLGEMQHLAVGVGDLKKVLTNVKTRGTWGEIQLGGLLAQLLSPEQYAQNVETRKGKGLRVEYAIRLPGPGDVASAASQVWMPIDAKFPLDTYERLVAAHEACDNAAVELESAKLEQFIKSSARDICEKYVSPPETTDFAILYLPTEGLFAEIVRRSGLTDFLQREYRVTVAGPTTLTALLNSLQMGFRTLAIQRRSSEVWEVLGAVKTEFGKFGEVLAKVEKKLQEAGNVIESAHQRTRVITRKLKDVQEMPVDAASDLLRLRVGATGGELDDLDEA